MNRPPLVAYEVVALLLRLRRVIVPCLGLIVLAGTARAQNVVLIIADDVGIDRIAAYGGSPTAGPTPQISSLASQGVLFRNAWVQPTCSPTRASLLTGLRGTDHGIGYPLDPFGANEADTSIGLDPSLWTLPKALSAAGYRTEAFGKWHLLGQPNIDTMHPNLTGFDHFAGFLWGGGSYFSWPKTVDGVNSTSTTYMTTDTADEAIAALNGSEPFFLWVAFLAAHTPWHEPPQNLHSYDLTGVPVPGNEPLYHSAMLEAMDTEMGRILAAIDWSDTTVIFIGDNGTHGAAIEPPFLPSHGKFTVYDGGVNVPMIVAGQAIAQGAVGQETDALFQATDMFATIAQLAGAGPVPLGSISAVPFFTDPSLPTIRTTTLAQRFLPNGGPVDQTTHHRSAREQRYKLVRIKQLPEQFYDLFLDPFELSPIPVSGLTTEQQIAYDKLDLTLSASVSPIRNVPLLGGLGRFALAGLLFGSAMFAGLVSRAGRRSTANASTKH